MNRIKKILVYSILSVMTALFVSPILWLIYVSLVDRATLFNIPPNISFELNLSSYQKVFIDGPGFKNFLYTVFISLAGSIIPVLLCFIFLAQRTLVNPRNKQLTLLLVPLYAMPTSLIAVPLYFVLIRFDFSNMLGLAISYIFLNTITACLLINNYLKNIKLAALDSLRINDQNYWNQFNVLAHDMKSPLIFVFLFCFLVCWQDLVFGVLFSSRDQTTLNVSLIGMITPIGTYWSEIAAISLPSISIAIVFVFLLKEEIYKAFRFEK